MEQQCDAKTRADSKYVSVLGSKMHFLQAGQGDPMVLLHGIPTSSYVWRNIIPALSTHACCIAPDMIGMGKSDKPNIQYTVFEHIDYFESFVEELGLDKITLVLHGWGSVLGFEYAKRHPDKVRAIAFFESHIRPTTDWDMLSLPVQEFSKLLSDPELSYQSIVEQNYILKRLLPSALADNVDKAILKEYEKPFSDVDSRKLLWQYVLDLPLGETDSDVVDLIEGYSQWLQQSSIPKLMLYAVPGFITTMDTVSWARDSLSQLTLESLDDVLHFAQETKPELFAEKLKVWYLTLPK